jgi:hypothetical protein
MSDAVTIFTKDLTARGLKVEDLISRMNEQLVRDRESGTCGCAQRGSACETRVVGASLGSTRTLFCLLVPMVLRCERAALLVAPSAAGRTE